MISINLCSKCKSRKVYIKHALVKVAGEYLIGKTLCGQCGKNTMTMVYKG